MSDRAAEYRKRAEECQQRADQTKDIDVKRQHQELASGWLALARSAERAEGRGQENG